MSVPTTGSADTGFNRGPRANKVPAFIIFVLIMLFVVGLLYGAKHRSEVKVQSDSGKVFDLDIVNDSTIDFLTNKPDGVAGAAIDDPVAAVTETGHDSTSEKDIAQWLEKQQIERLKREAAMRENFEQKQIDQYESALSSSMDVAGFGGGKPDSWQSASFAQGVNDDPATPENSTNPLQPSSAPTQSKAQIDKTDIAALIKSDSGKNLLRSLGIDPDSVNTLDTSSSTDTQGVEGRHQFIEGGTTDREFVLDAKLETPRGPYEIKTGHLISGAMISAVNSDLPGDIVAQVTKNVYDTASGQFLLIPQGTRLFGKYDAYTQLGQERLVIVWNRLVFEDGETLNIGGMQGYDSRGMSGFNDKVNTHFLRTLANALLISVVNASGEALVQNATDSESSNITINLASQFTDTTSNAFTEYLSNRLKIRPTLEIRAGYEFNIIVSKDINFPRPYERGFKSYNTSR